MIHIKSLVVTEGTIEMPINRGFSLYSSDSSPLTLTLGGGDGFILPANSVFDTGYLPENASIELSVAGTGDIIINYFY